MSDTAQAISFTKNGVVLFEPPPGMKVHPVVDAIRMMNRDEFARLVWSVKRNGLRNPISLTVDGVLLDGRNRLMACRMAGVEPRFETVDPEDPVAFICSKNIQRTHHTPSQCAVMDALFEDLYRDDPDCPIRVSPEARLVARYDDLVKLVFAGSSLAEAHGRALDRQREEVLAVKEAERLAHLRTEAPYLAIRVDEGELTVTEAVEAHEDQVRAPVLADHAAAIRTIAKRVLDDIIEVGRRLTECKALLRHGAWSPWLQQEFQWSDDTALNFMRVHEMAKSRTVRDLNMLPVSGLYLLAKPSTPEIVRDAIIARAEAGEALPVAEIKRLIDQARGKPKAARLQDSLRDLVLRMRNARPDDPLVAELHRLLFSDDDEALAAGNAAP
jgi:hypothetical protein